MGTEISSLTVLLQEMFNTLNIPYKGSSHSMGFIGDNAINYAEWKFNLHTSRDIKHVHDWFLREVSDPIINSPAVTAHIDRVVKEKLEESERTIERLVEERDRLWKIIESAMRGNK